jgi:hypothetical protein
VSNLEQTEFLQLNKPTGDDFGNDDRFWKENPDKIDAAIKNLSNLTRFEALGLLAMIAKGSVYLKNDQNLFGYLKDGITASNIATVEDNDIVRFGDEKTRAWIMGKDYVSIRSPKLELVEQWNSSYVGTTPTRTVYHSGNSTNHALFNVVGTQTLTQNTVNKLSIMNTIVSQFPSGNATSGTGAYKIPRSGVYVFQFTVRPTDITNSISLIRLGLSKLTGGSSTDITGLDIMATSSYSTGFYGGTFMYPFDKDDIVSPWINPLTENVTIQAGTKFNLYYLGDNPSS